MRLLEHNDDGEFSLTTKDFVDDIPRYAILSHTWGAEEVTFQELMDGSGKHKAGYKKIRFCGEQARRDGLQYFWVDTCCIDKSSSAELAEAINSMFQWYSRAVKCYAYLSDVSVPEHNERQLTWEPAFRNSRWFTRGWTLQELIAPASVEFFSSNGKRLGDRTSLVQQIHEITGIAFGVFQGVPLDTFSIDERFSWAAKRQTKRKEDKAYCLLGIFGIYLPPIYGEGDNSFDRLKAEIAKAPTGLDSQPISLPYARDAPFNSLAKQHDPICLENTRVDILDENDEIESDLDQDHHLPSSPSRKYWLLYIVITVIFTLLITWAWNSLSPPLRPRPPPPLLPTLPIFAIIGRTGVGKSTFIQALKGLDSNGRPPPISDELEPCTKNITFYKFSIRDIQAYIIDTPGFGDANMTDTHIMMNVFNALNRLSLEDRKIRLIYLYDISLSKFDMEAHKNLDYFESLVGLDNAESVALVTGKWRSDPTEEDTRLQLIREKGLKEKYWKAMLEVGTKYERHDGSSESALLIVQRLLQKAVMLKREPGWVRERLKIIEEQEKMERMAEEKMSKSREQQPKTEEQPFYSTWNPQTGLILKFMWTILRVLAVGVVVVVAIAFTREFQTLSFAGRIVWGLLWVSFPSLIVAFVYRWLYISYMALLSFDCLFLLFAVFTDPVPPPPVGVVWLACVFGFALNADMYYHWPHDASMYFW